MCQGTGIEGAVPVIPKSLRLWEGAPTSLPWKETRQIDYRPSSQFTEGSTIVFNIPGSGTLYTDVKRTQLYATLQILQEDGSVPNVSVGVCDLLLQSLFHSVELQLNQKIIQGGEGCYGYKAYIESLLNRTEEEKNSQLQAEGFCPEKPEDMENINIDDLETGNEAMAWRSRDFLRGRIGDLMGHLRVDFFETDRLLVPGVDMQLKFFPQKDDFVLKYALGNGGSRYKIRIHDIFLRMTRVQLEASLHATLEQTLSSHPALYPFLQTRVKALNLPTGVRSFAFEDVFTGDVPSVLIAALVNASAFEGHVEKNPFNFHHCFMDNIAVQVDGQYVPNPPERLEFKVT